MQFEMIHREFQNISMQVTGIRVDHHVCLEAFDQDNWDGFRIEAQKKVTDCLQARRNHNASLCEEFLSAEGHSLAFLRDPLAGALSSARRLAHQNPWCVSALAACSLVNSAPLMLSGVATCTSSAPPSSHRTGLQDKRVGRCRQCVTL